MMINISHYQQSRRHLCSFSLALFLVLFSLSSNATSRSLSLDEALKLAKASRAELRVAAARVEAATQRPTIVSSLDDPILAPAIDHKPVDPMMRSDRSITLEQSFPLSQIRQHKRRAAEADIEKYQAEVNKMVLKIEAEDAPAFFMLYERRRLYDIVENQHQLANRLSKLLVTRHATGMASQSDVLRLELEEARLKSRVAALTAEIQASEAMFNASLGRSSEAHVPPLKTQNIFDGMAIVAENLKHDLTSSQQRIENAHHRRAELRIAQAEQNRADAEVEVMKSMYTPMAMLKVGVADTMTAGRGYMLMVGISIPIWRERLHAGVREAKAMSNMARADQEAMSRMVEGEISSSIKAFQGAALTHRSFRDNLLPRSERTLAPTLSEYASGKLPLSAVLETSKALWSLQEEALMAETALGLTWIRVGLALGELGELR